MDLSNDRKKSVAGTWGVEKLLQMPYADRPEGSNSNLYATTSSSTFNRDQYNLEKERSQNKFYKFVSFPMYY